MNNRVVFLFASYSLLLVSAHTAELFEGGKTHDEDTKGVEDVQPRIEDVQPSIEDVQLRLEVAWPNLTRLQIRVAMLCIVMVLANLSVSRIVKQTENLVLHPIRENHLLPIEIEVNSDIIIDYNALTLIGLSNQGTTVFRGFYQGKERALKRLLDTHHNISKDEGDLLLILNHPNVVRYYGYVNNRSCTFVVLELCDCNLVDLIEEFSDCFIMKRKLVVLSHVKEKIHLWEDDGYPSKQLIGLIKSIVKGLGYLHKNRIVHRDLKPSNVLIQIVDDVMIPKLSDMGINKLWVDKYSVSTHLTECRTSGYKASKHLSLDRHKMSYDMFSLGCLIFFCITKGKRPFGDCRTRDDDIWNDDDDGLVIDHMPEAHDLVNKLINHTPAERLTVEETLRHPFFWESDKKMTFIAQVSSRIKGEGHEGRLERLVEKAAPKVFRKDWRRRIDPAIVFHFLKKESYTSTRLSSLLRLMKNSSSHFTELSKSVPLRDIVGSEGPEDLFNYFFRQFRNLFMEVYNVIHQNHPYNGDKMFLKYIG